MLKISLGISVDVIGSLNNQEVSGKVLSVWINISFTTNPCEWSLVDGNYEEAYWREQVSILPALGWKIWFITGLINSITYYLLIL